MHIMTAEFPRRWLTARPGSPIAERTDRATGYFAPWWIYNAHHVCPYWDIDYSTARCPAVQSVADKGINKHWHGCFEGVIVKNVKNLVTNEIWRLTGKVDEGGWFEGKWPD
jgi:hypothetical protein